MPGLDSLIAYLNQKFASISTLQNSITNINNTINDEIQILQTGIINIEITNPQNVSKESHYHTSHTDFMYQRTTTNNGNGMQFVIQKHILHINEKVIMSYRSKH